jgi:hypothetical protein
MDSGYYNTQDSTNGESLAFFRCFGYMESASNSKEKIVLLIVHRLH